MIEGASKDVNINATKADLLFSRLEATIGRSPAYGARWIIFFGSTTAAALTGLIFILWKTAV
jgi:hypothetical protein